MKGTPAGSPDKLLPREVKEGTSKPPPIQENDKTSLDNEEYLLLSCIPVADVTPKSSKI